MKWSIDGYDIYVSNRKDKKYDVYKDDKYVCSFGQYGMKHYKDKLGYYKNLDHKDEQRKKNFKTRFKKLIDEHDKNKPMYWANRLLW